MYLSSLEKTGKNIAHTEKNGRGGEVVLDQGIPESLVSLLIPQTCELS